MYSLFPSHPKNIKGSSSKNHFKALEPQVFPLRDTFSYECTVFSFSRRCDMLHLNCVHVLRVALHVRTIRGGGGGGGGENILYFTQV